MSSAAYFRGRKEKTWESLYAWGREGNDKWKKTSNLKYEWRTRESDVFVFLSFLSFGLIFIWSDTVTCQRANICTNLQVTKETKKHFSSPVSPYLSFPSTIPDSSDRWSPISSGDIISYVFLCLSIPSYRKSTKPPFQWVSSQKPSDTINNIKL